MSEDTDKTAKPPSMLDKAIKQVEEVTPKWLKVSVAIIVIVWNIPLQVRDWVNNTIDTRVHATVGPLKVQRDNEIAQINSRIDILDQRARSTEAFVRAMAIEQLGAKRYQEVELTAVDKTK